MLLYTPSLSYPYHRFRKMLRSRTSSSYVNDMKMELLVIGWVLGARFSHVDFIAVFDRLIVVKVWEGYHKASLGALHDGS